MPKNTTIEQRCAACGSPFQALIGQVRRGMGKYCSKACQGIAYKAAGRVERVCEQCGITFTITKWRATQQPGRYCSRACRALGRLLPRTTRPCEWCGKPVAATASQRAHGEGRFCSRSCVNKAVHTGIPKPISAEHARKLGDSKRGKPSGSKRPPIVKICERCGGTYERQAAFAARSRFCSVPCRRAWIAARTGPEHPLYRRVERRCEVCDKAVMVIPARLDSFRFCSRRCNATWVATTWPRTSSIEQSLRDELTRRGIPFVYEHIVGPWSVDIALPQFHIAIEADGTYWHGTPRQKWRDRAKDTFLAQAGWRVLRFSEPAIKADVRSCGDAIELATNQGS